MPASPPRRPIPPVTIGVRQVDIERGRGVGQGRLAPAAEVDVRSVDADVAEGAEIVALHVQVGRVSSSTSQSHCRNVMV